MALSDVRCRPPPSRVQSEGSAGWVVASRTDPWRRWPRSLTERTRSGLRPRCAAGHSVGPRGRHARCGPATPLARQACPCGGTSAARLELIASRGLDRSGARPCSLLPLTPRHRGLPRPLARQPARSRLERGSCLARPLSPSALPRLEDSPGRSGSSGPRGGGGRPRRKLRERRRARTPRTSPPSGVPRLHLPHRTSSPIRPSTCPSGRAQRPSGAVSRDGRPVASGVMTATRTLAATSAVPVGGSLGRGSRTSVAATGSARRCALPHYRWGSPGRPSLSSRGARAPIDRAAVRMSAARASSRPVRGHRAQLSVGSGHPRPPDLAGRPVRRSRCLVAFTALPASGRSRLRSVGACPATRPAASAARHCRVPSVPQASRATRPRSARGGRLVGRCPASRLGCWPRSVREARPSSRRGCPRRRPADSG